MPSATAPDLDSEHDPQVPLDFLGHDLSGAQLRTARLDNASFDHCRLYRAVLREARGNNVRMRGADARHLDGRDAVFNRWLAEGIDLALATLDGLAAPAAQLAGGFLLGTHLRGASLRGADMSGACLGNAKAEGVDLREAILRGASLNGAQLSGADLRGTDFRGADLDEVLIDGAVFDHRTLWPAAFRVPSTALTAP